MGGCDGCMRVATCDCLMSCYSSSYQHLRTVATSSKGSPLDGSGPFGELLVALLPLVGIEGSCDPATDYWNTGGLKCSQITKASVVPPLSWSSLRLSATRPGGRVAGSAFCPQLPGRCPIQMPCTTSTAPSCATNPPMHPEPHGYRPVSQISPDLKGKISRRCQRDPCCSSRH